MKKRNLSTLVFSGILFWGLVYTNQAQVPNNNFSQLRFSIETNKNWFVLSEPIPLTLKVSNEASSPIGGGVDLNPKYRRIRYFVEKPDKTVVNIEPFQMYSGTCEGCKTKFPLLPNITFENKDAVQNLVENIFSVEGDYKVWAEICEKECSEANSSKAASNQIQFKVYEPKGRDQEAY